MRGTTVVLYSAFCLSVGNLGQAQAQVFVGGQSNSRITITNGVAVGSNPDAQVNGQSIAPNLASSNATPAIGRSGIKPAIPGTNSPAINRQNPKNGFTTAIGQQGSGTAIGQQGSGTAIGQQGSGTAIGQQGVGTAISPPNNGVVIGQPEPFSTPTPNSPAVGIPPATGFSNSVPPGFGNRGVTNSATLGIGARPASTPPTPATSAGSVLPSGRR